MDAASARSRIRRDPVRQPTLRGIPDLVVEGDGYTIEFIGPIQPGLDNQDPSGMARLRGEPVKGKLPIGV